jgi:hypothetical protein
LDIRALGFEYDRFGEHSPRRRHADRPGCAPVEGQTLGAREGYSDHRRRLSEENALDVQRRPASNSDPEVGRIDRHQEAKLDRLFAEGCVGREAAQYEAIRELPELGLRELCEDADPDRIRIGRNLLEQVARGVTRGNHGTGESPFLQTFLDRLPQNRDRLDVGSVDQGGEILELDDLAQ